MKLKFVSYQLVSVIPGKALNRTSTVVFTDIMAPDDCLAKNFPKIISKDFENFRTKKDNKN